MASSSRASNRSPDDFAAFTQGYNNGHHNGDYYEYEDEDGEIVDYEPSEDMPALAPYGAEAKKQKVKSMKSPESRGRDPIKMPRVDLRSKLASMNEKVKRARMPSPGEMVDSYLNSGFHKQFKQPLAVRTRIEDVEVQKARQLLTQNMKPSELGNLRHPLDIPLPKFKAKATPSEAKQDKENEEVKFDPRVAEGSRMYNTLPRSWRTQNLVTSVREISDLEELARRKQLIETKSPAELGNINSFSDLPVPSKIKSFMSPSEKLIAAQKRHRSPEQAPETREFGTLSRSWTTTKLVTNTREIDDPLELKRRQELIRSKSPVELSQIRSFDEVPVPTKIQGLFRSNSKTGSITRSESMHRNFSMYATLPKSWKEQNLVTQIKVDQDPELVAMRRALTQEKTPAELSQIYSIADLPIPTTLENFLKKASNPEQPPSKPLYKYNLEDMYNTLPRSLKTEVLVHSKVVEDPELLKQRQELIKAKTPRELSVINGLEDFPLPTKIETMVRGNKRNLKSSESKEHLGKRSKSWSELANIETWKNNLVPETLKSEVLVRARVEDPELQKRRAEITKSCTVQQLSQINSLAEFPIPTTIERMINQAAELRAAQKTEKTAEELNKPLGEKLYDTLPRSMKSEVLVRVRDEDPELQKQRQELTRSKSPVELSRISSLSDFPVPKNIENLISKAKDATDNAGPTPPPRRFRREDIYATLPASFKTEVLVKSKIETDEELLKTRQELTRSKSPAQLSEIHGIEDFPIPTFVENLAKKKMAEANEPKGPSEDLATMKGWYNTLPSSLRSEVLVRARQEDPEIQRERAEVVKTKSVNELSQITSLDDFPLPKSIDQLIGRTPRPVERRKKFRQMQRSASAKSMEERMKNVVPESLKAQVLVKSRIEDPDVREFRRQLVQSKSVSELSQVTSLSDFPIPSTIERLVSKSKSELSKSEAVTAPSFDINDINIYATLPASLKSEVMVRSRIESPEKLEHRRQLAQSKSVSELSQIQSLADFPIPATIEKLIEARRQAKEQEEDVVKPPMTPARLQENIYATLPKSLKSEVLVRSRVESPDILKGRQELVQSKSVSELSQMKSMADFPVPTSIEHLIQKKASLKIPKLGPSGDSEIYEGYAPSSTNESNIYASLPRSLKKEVLVRSKIEENEDLLRERQFIVKSMSPGELSQIHSLSEVPLPRKIEEWLYQNEAGEKRSLSGRSSSIPRNKQELKEIVYNKFLPESLTRPVVVRCKTEDPNLLKQRQNVQQSKSIHELSKIRNLNEFPLPGRVKLPDLPLPSMKAVIGVIARVPAKKNKKPDMPPQDAEDMIIGYSPASTPKTLDKTYTDDEMLRYEMSSPESMAHREQDFDYEVIEAGSTSNQFGFMQTQLPVEETEESSISVADHYKGTPPFKRSKKKKNRYSSDSDYQVADETTPPTTQERPPSRPSRSRRNSQDPDAPVSRSGSGRRGAKLAKSASGSSANTMTSLAGDQWHSVRSTMPKSTADDDTLVDPDDLHSCADTLNDQPSDDEFTLEMLPRDRSSRNVH